MKRVEADAVEDRPLLVRRGKSEERLAAGGAVKRRTPSDLDAEPECAAAAALVDVEHLVVLDRAERDGFAQVVGETVEEWKRGAAQIEILPDAVSELEQPVAEPVGVVAVLVSDEPKQHERVEHPRERPFAQTGRRLQVLETGWRFLFADDVEEVEALRESRRSRRDVALFRLENTRLALRIGAAAFVVGSSIVHFGQDPMRARRRFMRPPAASRHRRDAGAPGRTRASSVRAATFRRAD